MSHPKLKLTYWDLPGGRGEPARLALTVGGVEFEDRRIDFSSWPEIRPSAPFHACPFLEVDGYTIGQSNTITRYVGKLTGLYPQDPWQAALCDEALDAVEDMWVKFGATMGLQGDALRAAREALVEKDYKHYLKTLAKRLKDAGGEYFADRRLTVADLQVMVICRALGSGKFDHISTDLVAQVAPTLDAHRKRVLETPEIASYYEALMSGKS